MNPLQRLLLTSAFLVLISQLPGCMTSALHADHKYQEKVSSVLIASDGKNIALLGDKYHYIIDAPQGLTAALNAPLRKKLEASIGTVKIDKHNSMQAWLRLKENEQLSAAERAVALQLGFKPDYDQQLELSYHLTGKRYSAGKFQPPSNLLQLDKTYSVEIVAEQSTTETLVRAPLTPIAVAADGAIIMGTAMLLPVLVPLIVTAYVNRW